MSTQTGDLGLLARAASPVSSQLHTAIPRPRWPWKTRILLPGVMLTGFGGLLAFSARDVLLPGRPVEVVPVVVKLAAGSTSQGSVVVQAPGWVEADPFSVSVSALADGVVKEVLVLEGQFIAAGQVVARLVDEDARLTLARTEADLSFQQAVVASADAALDAAQSEWNNPIERTRALHTAEANLSETRAELDLVPAAVASEQALYIELHAEHERVASVFESQSAASIELIRAHQRCDAQKAKVEHTQGRQSVLESRIRQLEAEATAARENLRLRIPEKKNLAEAIAGAARAEAELRRAAVALAEARLRLDRMEVRSPVAGIVQARFIEPGSKLSLTMDEPRSAQAVRLYDPAKLQVRVDVPLSDAAKVGVGQEAQVTVDVLSDRTFAGRVSRVVHEADVQKNTVQFKVALRDPAAELKPEMLARVKFLGRDDAPSTETTQRVFAPEHLVQRETGRPARVWLVDQAKGVAFSREVTLGDHRVDGWVELRQGLQPGDRLIAADPAGVRDGMRVHVTGEAQFDSAAKSKEATNAPD